MDITRFPVSRRGQWDDVAKQRLFLEELARKLDLHDYHTLTTTQILQNGGAGLLAKYDGSLSNLLIHLHPNYRTLCREAVQRISTGLNIKVEEVVNVPRDFIQAREPVLLRQHDHSVIKCKLIILQEFQFERK